MTTPRPAPNFVPHNYLSIQWNYSSTSDVAQEMGQFGFALSVGQPAGYYIDSPDAWLAQVGPLIRTWWASTTNLPGIDARARLNQVKLAQIKSDGTYNGPASVWVDTSNTPGGKASNTVPIFCTCAVTLHTNASTKLAKMGRVYPPFSTQASSGSGAQMVNYTGARDTVKALCSSIIGVQTAAGHGVQLWVVSRTGQASGLVTGFSCNDVIDVQRRRKNRIRGNRTPVLAGP